MTDEVGIELSARPYRVEQEWRPGFWQTRTTFADLGGACDKAAVLHTTEGWPTRVVKRSSLHLLSCGRPEE